MMTPRAQALFRGINRVLILLALFSVSAYSLAKVKAEDYATLPEHSNVTLSPDGKHYVVITRVDEREAIIVANTETGEVISVANFRRFSVRDIFFKNNKFIIINALWSLKNPARKGNFHQGLKAYAMDISTGKVTPILNIFIDLNRRLDLKSLNIISGFKGDGNIVYISDYGFRIAGGDYNFGRRPEWNLYRVNLNSGVTKLHATGFSDTVGWFVGKNGEVLAREDYNDVKKLYRVYSFTSGTRQLIYESDAEMPDIRIAALSNDEQSLLYAKDGVVYQISLADGTVSDSGYAKSGKEIQALKTDLSRKLVSISYAGQRPFDEPLDPEIAKSFRAFKKMSPNNHLKFMSASEDGQQIVVRISGNDSSGNYVHFNRTTNDVKILGQEYPKITKQEIGEISTFSYESRDGVSIPSVVTWPVGVDSRKRKKLPLLVLPHSRPEGFDHVSFNWWAQYFARKGYAILQPNFRGSGGFGSEYHSLSHKELAKTMQNDVADGVAALIKSGEIDSERVCIMGASYGGYLALAGGAFSPELYRCVISVSGISDLPRMLRDVKAKERREYRYLEKTLKSYKAQGNDLKAASPSQFTENYAAPVLLIHAKNDNVVRFKQSKAMHKALLKAGKVSELIELKGEDHWLSKSETRLAMLKAIEVFLEEHNPVQ